MFSILDEFTIQFSKADLEEISASLRAEITASALDIRELDEQTHFVFGNLGVVQLLYSKIKKAERQRGRSEYRRSLLNENSAGIYDHADIEAIFFAQEGLCYFSGEPLLKSTKNFSIDHLKPVRSGGSSWPSNLALVLKTVNQEKHGHTAQWYWQLLGARFGGAWLRERRQVAKAVDLRRRKIDRNRRAAVVKKMAMVAKQLQATFPDRDINYTLTNSRPILWIDGVNIEFPVGFIRERSKCSSLEYFAGIINAV
jgi:hypothetical protein